MASVFMTFRSGRSPRIEIVQTYPGEVQIVERGAILSVSWGDPSVSMRTGDAEGPQAGRTVARFDRSAGRVTVLGDTYGVFPAVVAADPGRITLASDLSTMIRHRPSTSQRITPSGLIDQLAFGQQIGTAGIWSGTEHIGAGARFEWRDDDARFLATDPIVLPDRRSGPQAALDALVAAVSRRLARFPEAVIPLSGGLDSRLLLACALASGWRPDTFCYGAATSADRLIAAALSAAAGCRHYSAGVEYRADGRAVRRIADTGGGEVAIHHGHAILGSDAVLEVFGRPILTGTGSETFRAFYFDRGLPGMSALGHIQSGRSGLRRLARDAAIRWVVEHMAGPRLELLSASGGRDLAEDRRAALETMVRDVLGHAPDLARGLNAAYLALRVGRFVAPGQQLLNRIHARMHPFLDPQVVTALSGLPVEWTLGARFHRWAINRLAPDLAAVDWDRTCRPMREGLHWTERWPGLAARLRVPATYAKAGAPLIDPGPWLASADVESLSAEALSRTGAGPRTQRVFADWIARLPRIQAAGVLAALVPPVDEGNRAAA